jgi:putative transcriptional regulator
MSPFGANVKTKRLEKKLSQEQLAEAAGVSQGAIWKIESGNGLPSLSIAFRIADALDTTVDELNTQSVSHEPVI